MATAGARPAIPVCGGVSAWPSLSREPPSSQASLSLPWGFFHSRDHPLPSLCSRQCRRVPSAHADFTPKLSIVAHVNRPLPIAAPSSGTKLELCALSTEHCRSQASLPSFSGRQSK